MIRPPRIVGHRGAAASAPENTLEGFRVAAAEGAGWVEFDVRLSADGVPMVIHDATLERTAGVAAVVDETTAAEIARLTNGHPTPTLAETMALLGALGIGANVEIKEVADKAAVAEAVIETLDEAAAGPAAGIPVLVSSFSAAILDEVRRRTDRLPIGLLVKRRLADPLAEASRLGCVAIHEDHRRLTPARIADWKAANFLVVCYTINDPERARVVLEWGVDSVITDAPGAIAEALDGGKWGHMSRAAGPAP